jgi:FkbM family methyltransferase
VENTYKELLPLEGETVLDIGANIGDSSIYFALNNAEKVIALEPFPETYLTAKKNIEENSLTNKITLLNAAYGKDCEVLLDDSVPQNGLSLLKPSNKGIKVKSYSLETLLNLYNINKAILKMDCEGCEYQILNENLSALRKFKRIELEFHYGYRNIENKLRSAGFSTMVLRVSKSHGKDSDLKSMALNCNDYTFGLLYAELI